MADKTFVFVGDTEVGSRLSQLLNAGGFSTAASLSDADVVFTYMKRSRGSKISISIQKGFCKIPKKVRCSSI